MQADAIAPGQTVVIVDDILATGAHLVHRLWVRRGLTIAHLFGPSLPSDMHDTCPKVDQPRPRANS
jgi:hypothetical protein